MVAICSTISILLGLKLKGKSLSEALILKHKLTQNMATDCFLNCEFSTYVKITSSEHVAYRNCFWHSGEFLYTTCSPPCSAKIRASDKDLPVSSISSSNNRLHLTTSMLICSSWTSHRPPRLNFLTFVTIMYVPHWWVELVVY